jgi:hypothetical protein
VAGFADRNFWTPGIVYSTVMSLLVAAERSKARVFRRDSPPMRSRGSRGSGGQGSSMLTSVEGNAVQAFSGFYN